jgi:tRNA (guanine-N7-)-methyltransferase
VAEQLKKALPRSYVRRAGRITRAQSRALDELWPVYGLVCAQPLDLKKIFGRTAPCLVEIGFGMGDSLAELAAQQPEHDFIGIEVHEAGIGRLMSMLAERSIDNVRNLRGDAALLMVECFEIASLAGVLLYFPDPWPKKRHHKRRLVQPGFVELVAEKLARGGQFRLATDWSEYAQQMLEVIETHEQLANVAGPGQFMPTQSARSNTKFELRGQRLGHEIFDLCFERL